jgi:hypothetical protein
MAPSGGSTWSCGLCQVTVWVRRTPRHLRHANCRKWMVRVWPRNQG